MVLERSLNFEVMTFKLGKMEFGGDGD